MMTTTRVSNPSAMRVSQRFTDRYSESWRASRWEFTAGTRRREVQSGFGKSSSFPSGSSTCSVSYPHQVSRVGTLRPANSSRNAASRSRNRTRGLNPKPTSIQAAAATRDLATYKELMPGNIDYDPKAKSYVLGSEFRPLFDFPPERVLSWLTQGFGDGFGGLERPALRAADQTGYREPGQRVGQPSGLLPALLREFRVGTLAGLGPKRQGMPDEQQLHGCGGPFNSGPCVV